MVTVKINLSRILGEKRWKQIDLHRATGIRPSTIGDWYHEMNDHINLEHLALICKALDCDICEILELQPKKSKHIL